MIAQDVFLLSMSLMDEQSSDGTFAGYDSDYKKKAWPILSVLQTELLPRSVQSIAITSDQSILQISDQIGVTILPYGLAAQLLIHENPQVASFFNDRYEELKRKRPALKTSIKDVYGIKEGGEETTPTNPNVSDSSINGGSFLNPSSGVYDGGGW
jgi:hypothetical protein